MPDAIALVKKAAVEAVEASKPVNVLFGTVVSTSPLKIQTDQKSIYTAKMLVVTQNVSELRSGEKVVMLRIQGGKRILVLDRVAE